MFFIGWNGGIAWSRDNRWRMGPVVTLMPCIFSDNSLQNRTVDFNDREIRSGYPGHPSWGVFCDWGTMVGDTRSVRRCRRLVTLR